ncbi:MAG: di-heme oxidoredictase family protein [Gemmatimonadota bacterium]
MNGRLRALALLVALAALASSCDGLITAPPEDADILDSPLPGLTAEEMAAFARGDAEFGRRFAPSSGLGPIFNNVACAECHSGDGRGRPDNILTRFSVDGELAPELGGPQIQDKAIPGAVPETLPPGAQVSLRLPPPVFGVGLIEAIPAAAILANADPDDADGDGVSGRPNMVTPPEFVPASEPGGGPGPVLGRFSRKAQVSTLLEQTSAAYHQDMGITSDFIPEENTNPLAGPGPRAADEVPDPEIPASTVNAVIDYIRMLAPPAAGASTERRRRGQALFAQVGCASCHVPELRTGASPIAAIADRPVPLYSDLLLHDMGDELADGRPDGDANGREWRTAPLWGLRVMRDFLAGDAFLLHDGRARSVDEAIGFHGGEGAAARAAYGSLSDEDRAALLDFVKSR